MRSAALLEYPREYVALLDDDPALGHSHIRCTCGSDKVFNYGLPRNNGRYFLCRTCERSFKAAVYRQQWDTMYEALEASNPPGTSWLESYEHLLGSSGALPIMDLGCGCGEDTAYLRQQGFATLSCDYSETALRRLSGLVRSANSACFDMLDGLPFPSDAFNVVVANLSLHYFSWHDTQRIVADIRRVLADDGYLLCRVNSVADTENGAGQGARIEENYYNVGGKPKRFFDKEQLGQLFRGWELLVCDERRMIRSGKTKIFWEVVVRKR
ncbi:MAG: class I SAM-dependent methyltransferase [Candidatus Methylomirabilia bacterium]